eukprot:6137397-Pyramimonas_sp.AAC.1
MIHCQAGLGLPAQDLQMPQRPANDLRHPEVMTCHANRRLPRVAWNVSGNAHLHEGSGQQCVAGAGGETRSGRR